MTAAEEQAMGMVAQALLSQAAEIADLQAQLAKVTEERDYARRITIHHHPRPSGWAVTPLRDQDAVELSLRIVVTTQALEHGGAQMVHMLVDQQARGLIDHLPAHSRQRSMDDYLRIMQDDMQRAIYGVKR